LQRPWNGLGCWTAITCRREGAREENFPAPKPLDGANKGRDFAAAVEEKRLAVELATPATSRRGQGKKTGSEKKPPSRRRHVSQQLRHASRHQVSS
jgi:hypothetical protein